MVFKRFCNVVLQGYGISATKGRNGKNLIKVVFLQKVWYNREDIVCLYAFI